MPDKKKCIVYGGGGFIGSHLCEKLLEEGNEVTLFDKLNFSKNNINQFESRVKIIEGDFNNEIDIKNSLNGIDYVFHLVSSTLPASSNDNPVYDVESNLISSLKLFKECLNNKIRKIIFLSSGGTVYGVPDQIPVHENYFSNPICSYGIVKRTIEEYLYLYKKLYGLNYSVFRLSNPYGERQNPFASQGVIAVFLNKIINDQTIEIWGNGEIIRDYIYIKDAVDVLAMSLEKNSSEDIFNLSSGTGISLNMIAELAGKIAGKKPNIVYKEARNVDVPVSILNNEIVKREFNWEPETSIEKGIETTYNYLIKQKTND
jgi:UDP-glucose 4-epimerase